MSGLTGIPGTYPEPASFCTRLDYHDGPCNGFSRRQCELKNKIERECKVLGTKASKEWLESQVILSKVIRPWYKQAWAWISGRL